MLALNRERHLGGEAVTLGTQQALQGQAGPFRLSSVTFPTGLSNPPHFHDWACVSVIIAGRFLQRFPGKAFECLPGGVIAKPPGERHADQWFDTPSRHVIIEIDPVRHQELGSCRAAAEEIFYQRDMGAVIIAHSIARELAERDSATPIALEGLALQLLARIVRRSLTPAVPGSRPAWLSRVREYLHDNYQSGLRLTDLASVAGVHPDHLSRVFAAVYGESVGQYLRRLRTEAALALLSSSDLPLSTIAQRCGFADQSHLTRVVKRAVGVTPGAYRAAHTGR